ncbi:MAG: M24 family metallopeptidase [Terriglobia bacterium]
MINQERLERMRQAMDAERLDALVLRLPENVLLLSGFWPMVGATVLIFPLDGKPVCVIPQCFEVEASMALWGATRAYYRYGVLGARDAGSELAPILRGIAQSGGWKRIGYEGSFETIAPAWNSAEILVPFSQTPFHAVFDGCEVIDASLLLQSQRRRKTAYEIAKLRTVNAISCIGLETFERSVEVGVSGVELAAAVEREVMARGAGLDGAQRVRAYAQVAVGPEESALGYRPSEVSTRRPLRHGDAALLELGVVADGYWADRTRVRVAGEPDDEQVKIFEVVRRAQEAAIGALRSGITGAEADQAARSVIRDAGYAEFFPHITGHGLGFCYHESAPKLAPDSTDTLEENMVTSVEPGVYLKPPGGFRIEDDVVITKDGAEILGPFPKVIA